MRRWRDNDDAAEAAAGTYYVRSRAWRVGVQRPGATASRNLRRRAETPSEGITASASKTLANKPGIFAAAFEEVLLAIRGYATEYTS